MKLSPTWRVSWDNSHFTTYFYPWWPQFNHPADKAPKWLMQIPTCVPPPLHAIRVKFSSLKAPAFCPKTGAAPLREESCTSFPKLDLEYEVTFFIPDLAFVNWTLQLASDWTCNTVTLLFQKIYRSFEVTDPSVSTTELGLIPWVWMTN